MPDKRRLLVVSHGFPPYYGGAEHAAGHLAAAAASSGRWSVDVLTSDIGGRLPSCETWRGVNVVRVPARKRHWTNHNVVELLSFLRSASRNIELKRPDWILAHFTLPGGEVARRLAARYGSPFSVVLHGSDVPGYQNARFGMAYAVIRPWIRRIWQGAASVIAVSEPLRDLALRTWPMGRIDVVPNGVDLERFQPAAAGDSGGHGDRIVLVAVAQLIERKGLQHLITALAQLPDSLRKRVRLRLYGGGAYEGELRRRVKEADLNEQVEFAGLVSYEEVPNCLRQADVFVLPSLQEGLPLSLLEAMASGLPVVATAVGGIPDVVKDGENGLLVPPADPQRLSGALVRLLADSDLRGRMAAAVRRDVLPWAWNAVWERYETVLSAPKHT